MSQGEAKLREFYVNNNSNNISMAGNSTTSTPVQRRIRSDSKSTDLANTSDFSAGESTSELLEIDTPPLVLISSRVKSPKALSGCASTGVVVVRYTYESTSLIKLLQLIGSKMKGRHALSIAFLMHGNPSCLKLCSQKVGKSSISASIITYPPRFVNGMFYGHLYRMVFTAFYNYEAGIA